MSAEKKRKPAAPVPAEQRNAFRASVTFPVEYLLDESTERRHGYATDLSALGLRLVTDEPIAQETTVALAFTLPSKFVERLVGGSGERPPRGFAPMELRGRVVSSVAPQDEDREDKTAHGIAFLNLDARTRDELSRFVHLWQLYRLRTKVDAE